MRDKSPAKWGVQMAGMNFKTHSRVGAALEVYWNLIRKLGKKKKVKIKKQIEERDVLMYNKVYRMKSIIYKL
ncbi:hypothetical protein C823_005040 [Eubacterium plexicaudatum ASF492]|nr:hypothetical protein C823_005040 [Eubacterium plexicaudatum ASF492]